MKELELPDDNLNILVVLMGALGDIARGISILKPIKEKYPGAKITWVTHKVWKPFLELHDDINETLVFDKTFKGAVSLRKEMRLRKFNLTLDLQRNFKSGVTSFLSASKIRIGFNKKNSKEFNYLFNTHSINFFDNQKPKLLNYLDFLRLLKCETGSIPNFGLNNLASKNILENIQADLSKSYLSIVLGSSWESKDWFISGYKSFIDEVLKNSELNVCLLGAGAQAEVGKKLKEVFSSKRVINLSGKTNLQQMVAVLKEAKVNIGPDSGPGHVSAALNVPYISIFGPTNPNRVAPYNCEDLVVRSKIACSPCWKRSCPGLDRLCMRLISGNIVWNKVKFALGQTV